MTLEAALAIVAGMLAAAVAAFAIGYDRGCRRGMAIMLDSDSPDDA